MAPRTTLKKQYYKRYTRVGTILAKGQKKGGVILTAAEKLVDQNTGTLEISSGCRWYIVQCAFTIQQAL